MANRLTIYQRLNKTLGNEVDGPKYVIDPSSFDGLSGNELDQKKLEAQQTIYLQNQWKKIDNELYQKAVYYEPTRIASYYDYEAMEYTPEISVALDIFAEEATTANENGKVLTIYSDSSRIKNELTNLFENILDINGEELLTKTSELKETILSKVTNILSESKDADLETKLKSVRNEVTSMTPSKYNYYRLTQLKNGLD
mgnify:CR=1 FL=1